MKPRSLQREITTYFVILSFVSILIVGIVAFLLSRNLLKKQTELHTKTVSQLVAKALLEQKLSWEQSREIVATVQSFVEHSGALDWTILLKDQPSISNGNLKVFQSMASEVFKTGESQLQWVPSKAILKETPGEKLIVYVPLEIKGQFRGALGLVFPENIVQAETQKIRYAIVFYAVVFALILAWFGYRAMQHMEGMRKRLISEQKFASIGRLAAGIAHEVGNPLGAVLGYLSILKRSSSDSETIDILTRSEDEISRINRIVRQLLDYSRPLKSNEPCDVNEVIRMTVESICRGHENLETSIQMKLQPDLPKLTVDSDYLRQVLLNLLQNALDAVSGQGEVHIQSEKLSIKRLSAQARQSLSSFLSEGEGEVIQITVEDKGPGIDSESLNKIFEPFFTTKPLGKGTGLGLYVSSNLVSSMGGFLYVHSEKGKGTCFFLVFPLSKTGMQNLRG